MVDHISPTSLFQPIKSHYTGYPSNLAHQRTQILVRQVCLAVSVSIVTEFPSDDVLKRKITDNLM